ncbi:MAG: hypothetical protein A3H94_06255 [Acidobacteria bacterium RIFCSPLOWO2_02_FULL_60_20]|nr:MAG: hypothetical protein A3H94_06255 [Acidobacteria bacterium RIFCSPLOWO2_02_FULL_60_20]
MSADSPALPDLTSEQRVALVSSHSGRAQKHLRAAKDAACLRIAEAMFSSQNCIPVVVYDSSPCLRILTKNPHITDE